MYFFVRAAIINYLIKKGRTMDRRLLEVQRRFGLPPEEAQELVAKYWRRANELSAKEFQLDPLTALCMLVSSDKEEQELQEEQQLQLSLEYVGRGFRPQALPKNRRKSFVKNRVRWSDLGSQAYDMGLEDPNRMGVVGNDQGQRFPCVGTIEQDLHTGWWRCLRCGLVSNAPFVDHYPITLRAAPHTMLKAG